MNDLCGKIVDDIHITTNIYGLPREQANDECRSRVIFSVSLPSAQRNLALTDVFRSLGVLLPCFIKGRPTSRGRIEYLFQAFGGIALPFIEVKHNLAGGEEYLDAVTQVIAEADGNDSNNLHFLIIN